MFDFKKLSEPTLTEEQRRCKYEKEHCKCDIAYVNICKCAKPQLELIKINQQFWCNGCNKWKCRCV